MAGLYIHIPYCIRKCAYCDFVSVPTECGVPEAYFRALLKEIDSVDEVLRAEPIESVFIGGGTPSLLTPKQLAEIVRKFSEVFKLTSEFEFTIECNPGTVNFEKLTAFRNEGVNRLSIGLQSAQDSILKKIGRIHTYSDFLTAIDAVHKAGYSNYNVDVMYGLPEQTPQDLFQTIDAVSCTGATHISAYSLILEEDTPLYRAVNNGDIKLPDADSVADMEDMMREQITSCGYTRYEISNYAKDGYTCKHNRNYWLNGPYIGFGVAAHSAYSWCGEWSRWNNTSSIFEYIGSLSKGKSPVENRQIISRDEEMFETIMLGLRMTEGIRLDTFFKRYGLYAQERYQKAIEQLRIRHWLNEKLYSNGWLALSPNGLDMQNAALLLFME